MREYLKDAQWQLQLDDEFTATYFNELSFFLDQEYHSKVVFPSKELIFNALNMVSFDDVKVVILGQDPYHGEGEAIGLAFAVKNHIKIPPSLRNILKELFDDLKLVQEPNLTQWAREGVLLLNTVLTVEKDSPASHRNKGWEIFTDAVIKKINQNKENIVFILWGADAQKKNKIIDLKRHFVIESSHPSPLGAYRGFMGSKPFSRANQFLESKKIKPINW